MLRRIRTKLTFANVVSMIALWVALSSSVAYAANTIFSEDIVNGEVKTADIHGNAVTNGKLAGNSVTGAKVANGTLTASDLAANSVANGKIQPNSVTSSKVKDDTLTNGGLAAVDLAASSVGSSEIAANAVGQSEIATDGVGATEIANNTIDAGEVVDFGLTNQDIGVLFAEVNANGTLASSSGGGVSVIRLSAGNYEVDFSRNVTACTAVATIGPAGSGSAAGEINVADRGGNAEAVFVATDTSAGASADRPFRLVVVC